ncbi:MAG TPA: BMC domain-containing protein [Patescibacteria group bacterium]|nr:BMC domain-containing protein [Patescibacteria group bacterium]
MATTEKQRVIHEYVPGKQITLAHLIANPKKELCEKLGFAPEGAIGIMTITPTEAAIIAADVATKTAAVQLCFVDRFTGTVVISGAVSAVEAALSQVNSMLTGVMAFTPADLTKS